MIIIQTEVKRKSAKPFILTTAIIVAILVLALLSVFVIRKSNLNSAIKNLDIDNESTVIRVMKYGGDNKEIVYDIAKKYTDAKMYTDGARLAIYASEYLDAYKDFKDLLNECLKNSGASQSYIDGFANKIKLNDFEITTSFGSDGYGIADGIYTEFLSGYAKAKISSIIPLDIYAFGDGAYFLDSSDRFIKSISKDGCKVEVIVNEKANEFIYYGGQIYYIDSKGQPHGKNPVVLLEGEQTMNLRIEAEKVICTVYDENFESMREITL